MTMLVAGQLANSVRAVRISSASSAAPENAGSAASGRAGSRGGSAIVRFSSHA